MFARSSLEVASPDLAVGEALMDAIVSTSVQDSVYRNQTLQISFQTGTKDEYGDVEKPEQLRVSFKRIDTVSDDDLVIDEGVRKVLLRNVVDLHERRDLLKAYEVPVRRGVLLYGPPGTGKTYACRYLCGKLPNATRIMVTGSALLQVGHVFQLARLLEPAVLFLEDVDLVFMSREVNLYSSVLGELLDHMDGLRPFEDIGFVLTTNAIERMEAAVRDRPGRISQCIHFGPPNPDIRFRYLTHYLRRYDCSHVELERLVRDSEGATQAFLKEWVHRAVQVGSERVSEGSAKLILETSDFEESLREMRTFSEGSTARIIGFHK
jgi:SpoVK/Ycf46/Vps4 family AAA+-type ATPase